MTKRIKRVFSSANQVIHLWANESQDNARSANVFFEGNKIYSYGYHYELGRLVDFKGKLVAVINDKGYSVTTNKHINAAWQAVSHLPRVKSAILDVESGLKSTQDKLNESLAAILRRRTFYNEKFGQDSYEINQVNEFNAVCKALVMTKYQVKVTAKYIKEVNEHIQKCVKRQAELKSPEYLAKKQANALKKASSDILKWKNGGPLVNSVRNLKPMLLRIINDEVQTSGGASVPLDHAKRLFDLYVKRELVSGERVGHFKVDAINGDIVKIGCHTISVTEAKSVLVKE